MSNRMATVSTAHAPKIRGRMKAPTMLSKPSPIDITMLHNTLREKLHYDTKKLKTGIITGGNFRNNSFGEDALTKKFEKQKFLTI